MFGRNRYLCDVRREKSPADKEGVYCIRPKEQNRQKRTRRMKGHDAPLFCICHVAARAPHQHIKTAWEYCFRSFLVRRLAMPRRGSIVSVHFW